MSDNSARLPAIRVSPEFRKRVRSATVELDTDVSTFMREAIEAKLAKVERSARRTK